jgi:hypothetical protein
VPPLSDEQPTVSSIPARATRPESARNEPGTMPVFGVQFDVVAVSMRVPLMCLKISRQSLQVGHGHPEPRLAIIVRVAGQGQSILRIDHLQHRGFSRLVA